MDGSSLSSPPDAPPSATPLPQPAQCAPIHLGIYVDDCVFYSTDPEEEKSFQKELEKRIKVDFMGDVDYFLGTAFTRLCHNNGYISVHITQSAFVEVTWRQPNETRPQHDSLLVRSSYWRDPPFRPP
mmetsp:Transcript_31580/g.53861  ORF Transcript_31580/g.53861 Transcript_31580/m.53861 type:complete len:127 (+) Transcript_31580:449-829(+)